jgi:acyl-coenzyme A synthetase/AMP-(fatty) acid ligase
MHRIPRLAANVFFHARRRPGAVAVIRGLTPITYAALADDLAAVIRTLTALNPRPGAIAAIAHEDYYTQLLMVFGCEALGLTTGSFRPQEGPECHPLLGLADIVFTTHPTPHATGRVIELTPDWLAAALANPPPTPPHLTKANPTDIAVIFRSSGTTGASKLMPITYAAERARMAAQRDPAHGLGLTQKSRYLSVMHFAVGVTYRAASNLLRLGGTFMFEALPEPGTPVPDPATYLTQLAPTHTSLSPHQLRSLLASLPPRTSPLLPNLTVQGVGAKLPRDLREAALQTLAGRIEDRYGTNETGPIGRVDSAGILILAPGIQAQIVNPSGTQAAQGDTGAIRLRAPGMITHYLNDPTATAEMFHGDPPWFQPGDLGTLIAPGQIRLAGRMAGILNLGGRKIAAADLEAKILAATGLADVAILQQSPLPQMDGPAHLVICAVPTPRLNPADLHRLISPLITYPFRIRLVSAIPRTPSGKIQRDALQAAIFSSAAALTRAGISATVPPAAASPTKAPAIVSET